MIKVGMVSLGCAKNLVDSEMILGMLNESNFQVVNTIEEADVLICNTCGFINASKEESINSILELASYQKKLVVTGCLVQRYKEELMAAIPEVDLYVSINEYPHINELIMMLFTDEVNVQPLNPFVRLLSTPNYQAYLRISEGCNNCCTYCAIPLIRGKFVSRPFEDILKEAHILLEKGIKELVVISQDTTRYGSDFSPKITIATLLKELLKLDFVSIRLLYLYPDEIEDDLIQVIKENQDRLSPYFDIPLQHASNKVLKAMNRRGTKEEYLALIRKIRKEIPNAILRTTYIVGFPGETKRDFEQLINFTKEVKFDHMGAFTYSREEGTKSFDYKGQVRKSTKQKRYDELMKVQKVISYEQNKKHINEIMTGLVVGYDQAKNEYQLRSYWNAPDDIDGYIYFKSKKELTIGESVKIKITNAFVYDLFGELVD
ncbi:MAG: 30S ribosomal protein S12 methylthiotransferase RimO [Bacilli bacterium]|nr:30S ribosomal protein S12 methylthiotransferase RimO [Bacilli bacterium]